MRTIPRRKKRTQPRERTATPAELEDDRARWIRAKTAAAGRDTAGTSGAADTMGTTTAARANIRALRTKIKRTATVLAVPSTVDLVFGGGGAPFGGGGAPLANEPHHVNDNGGAWS